MKWNAKADMNTARLRLDNAATNANAAADTISGKVEAIRKSRIAVEVAPNDWLRLSKVSKTIIDGENGVLNPSLTPTNKFQLLLSAKTQNGIKILPEAPLKWDFGLAFSKSKPR